MYVCMYDYIYQPLHHGGHNVDQNYFIVKVYMNMLPPGGD